jgi:hypothetical protein
MNEKVLKCLYDIKLAIEKADSFFIGRHRRFNEKVEGKACIVD